MEKYGEILLHQLNHTKKETLIGINTEDNRCFINEHVNERELREIYLKNFQIPIELAHYYSIMTSYNHVNGLHTANQTPVLHNVVHNEYFIIMAILHSDTRSL